MRGVGQRECPHLPSGLVRGDPNLAEQLLDVDAGVDEEVAGGEGDERERDRGGQVRAAVFGQELLGLLGSRLLRLPLLPFLASLFVLRAKYLPEADLEAVLLGDLLAVLASSSLVSGTAESGRRGCRRGRAARKQGGSCLLGCSNWWLRWRYLAVGAAWLARGRADAAMDGARTIGWSGTSRGYRAKTEARRVGTRGRTR